MKSTNSTLLAIGAALLFSLFCIDAGFAMQIDKNQTANLSIKQVSTTPNPCGGRTGAACRNDSPTGSGEMATDGSRYTITTSASAAGMLVGVGLITLVGLGAKRLRHPHGHHDGHHA